MHQQSFLCDRSVLAGAEKRGQRYLQMAKHGNILSLRFFKVILPLTEENGALVSSSSVSSNTSNIPTNTNINEHY